MTPNDFEYIAEILKNSSGFSLTSNQIYLLESRLGPILRQNNLISLEDLINSLRLHNEDLQNAVVEAVSINNTRFFRNKYVFKHIEDYVRKRQQQKTLSKIKILSAGCASGQEPVSIALLLEEIQLGDDASFEIYGLDISKLIISRAKRGTYTHYEVQKGLPYTYLSKYFDAGEDGTWRLKDSVLHKIHYYVHNLINLFFEKDFDVVLCRNMLSYMTEEAQHKILENLSQVLKSDGLLIIGASEILHENPFFEKIPDKMGCYRCVLQTQKRIDVKNTGWGFMKKPLFKSAIKK